MIETVLDYLLIYWALPSLVTMLLLIQWARHGGERMEYYSSGDWWTIIIASAVYPIGLVTMVIEVAWPWLIKERGK